MKKDDIIINPNFENFINRAYMVFEILNIILAVILPVWYYFLLFVLRSREYIAAVVLTVVSMLLVYIITRKRLSGLMLIKKALSNIIYLCITMTVVLLIVFLVSAFTGFRSLPSQLIPNAIVLNAREVIATISDGEFVIISISILISMVSVVRDIFYNTLTTTPFMVRFKTESGRRKFLLSVFMIVLVLATFSVFKVLGNEIWSFTLSLLGDLAVVEFFISLGLIIYYVKILLSGSYIIEDPEAIIDFMDK